MDKQKFNPIALLSKSLEIRGDVSPAQSLLLMMIPLALCLLLWFSVTAGPVERRAVSPLILPSPVEMAQGIPKLFSPERKLFLGIYTSFRRIFWGFIMALALAFPLGILMGAFTKVNVALSPLMIIGSYIPVPTLVPLTLAWLGTGEEQKIGFLGIASFVYLLPAIVKAISDVDNVFLNTGYTLGARKLHIISKIMVPIAMPKIYDSMRAGFGVGFTWIIVAEMIGADSGLGYILKNAQSRGSDMSIVYLTLLVIMVLAFLIDYLWRLGYKHLFKYKEPG